MRDTPYTPVIIAVILGFAFVLTGSIYYFAFSLVPGGGVVRLVILVGTITALGALVYVVWQRMREIKEEDPDDYRKY